MKKGEVRTEDWSPDHPHHRGIYWAWPEGDWQGRRGDLHALQAVFARPTGQIRVEEESDFVQIVAENQWQWEDGTPIVREQVTVCARRKTAGARSTCSSVSRPWTPTCWSRAVAPISTAA